MNLSGPSLSADESAYSLDIANACLWSKCPANLDSNELLTEQQFEKLFDN